MTGHTESCHRAKAPAGQTHLHTSSAKRPCRSANQTLQAELEWSSRALHWRRPRQCLSRSRLFLRSRVSRWGFSEQTYICDPCRKPGSRCRHNEGCNCYRGSGSEHREQQRTRNDVLLHWREGSAEKEPQTKAGVCS